MIEEIQCLLDKRRKKVLILSLLFAILSISCIISSVLQKISTANDNIMSIVLGIILIVVDSVYYISGKSQEKEFVEIINSLDSAEKKKIKSAFSKKIINSETITITPIGLILIDLRSCAFIQYNDIEKISSRGIKGTYNVVICTKDNSYAHNIHDARDVEKLKKYVNSKKRGTKVSK